jgi:hypothetical protein
VNVHDEMSDSEVLRAASEVLSRISVAAPPDVGAITARGRARRNRRLAGAAGLSVAAAAAALALSLTGALGPSEATAPGSLRATSFTLVSHHNGTVTLTINMSNLQVLLDTTALQHDFRQDGIPALVTSGAFCFSSPAPAGFWHVVSGSQAPRNVHPGEVFTPENPPTLTFNPAAIPAGTELSIGVLPPSSLGGHRMQGVSLGLIDANSHTCTSKTEAQVSQVSSWSFFWPVGSP